METKRLTASEREALLRLNVAMEILILDIGALSERARLIPYAKRDMTMMAKKAEKLLGEFARTIPDAQLMTYRRSLESFGIVSSAFISGQALDMIPNDTTDREDGDCPYYTLL